MALDARDGMAAREGDDGNAHPQEVAGGGAAGVGIGVEGEVDAGEGGQIIRLAIRRLRADAFRGNARAGEQFRQALPGQGVAELALHEQEARSGDGGEDAGPGGDDGRGDLGQAVGGAEGDVVRGGGGQFGQGGGIVGGAIAPVDFGEAQERFGVQHFGRAGGIRGPDR